MCPGVVSGPGCATHEAGRQPSLPAASGLQEAPGVCSTPVGDVVCVSQDASVTQATNRATANLGEFNPFTALNMVGPVVFMEPVVL